MYIKKEDFNYFENLFKELDERKREKFLVALLKAGKKSGENISKIQVVDDNERKIDPGEFITKTMIKKAYKTAQGGN